MSARTNFLLLLASVPMLLPAQAPPFVKEMRKEHLPGVAYGRSGTVGDLDGDGDPDVIQPFDGDLLIWKNDGRGRLAEYQRLRLGLRFFNFVQLLDIDGDADLDAVTVAWQSAASVQTWRNDGRGRFSSWSLALPTVAQGPYGMVPGDFNRDGRMDLVVSTTSESQLWLNRGGTRGFVDATSGRLPAVGRSVQFTAFDYDFDGDVDLFARFGGLQPGSPRMLQNDGTGRFTDVTATTLPTLRTRFASAVVGDFDGNGWLDLFLGGQNQTNRMWLNLRGTFRDATATFLPREVAFTDPAAAPLDVDGDGDLDLLVYGSPAGGGITPPLVTRNRLLLNEGNQRLVLAPAAAQPRALGATSAAYVADFDRDGHQDAFSFNVGQEPTLLLSEGDGRFRNASRMPVPQTFGTAGGYGIGDLDGDRLPDLVLGRIGEIEIYPQLRPGRFGEPTVLPLRMSEWAAPALGDIDGDGDLDLVVGMSLGLFYAPNRVYLNDGAGRFVEVSGRLPGVRNATYATVLFDADGDGDLDVFFGTSTRVQPGPSRLLRNDGRGFFAEVAGAVPANFDCRVARSADLDGDGDVDLVLGGQGVQILLNDGSGQFRVGAVANAPAVPCPELNLGDIDGDGDLDIGVGTGNMPYTSADDVILENLGQGRFAALSLARFPSNFAVNEGIVFHDFDFDGDLDVITQTMGSVQNPARPSSVYENDGRGNFTDVSGQHERRTLFSGGGIESVDIDLDGDPDLVHFGTHVDVRANLRRELHVPYLTRIGGDLEVDVWLRAATAPVPLAWLFVAPAELPQPVFVAPFGNLGINPLQALQLGPYPVTGDRARIRIPVPNASGLAGLKVYLQGLCLEGVAPDVVRLTRHVEVELRR